MALMSSKIPSWARAIEDKVAGGDAAGVRTEGSARSEMIGV
jgi:hypothetical protein